MRAGGSDGDNYRKHPHFSPTNKHMNFVVKMPYSLTLMMSSTSGTDPFSWPLVSSDILSIYHQSVELSHQNTPHSTSANLRLVVAMLPSLPETGNTVDSRQSCQFILSSLEQSPSFPFLISLDFVRTLQKYPALMKKYNKHYTHHCKSATVYVYPFKCVSCQLLEEKVFLM